MAYPFLPVNPSCGSVVVNDVCGYSSVVTNSSCNSNNPCSTTLTASSTIVYNGPVLSCIIAEPCDTLNVILQKIDEIICNLLSQINILNSQVNNINNQVITINNEIIDINNVLGECCTTTTSTTTEIICYEYILETSGPTGTPGDSDWSALDCYTSELVRGTITYPDQIRTGCILDGSLVIGSKVVTISQDHCATTTTTTTILT